MQTKLEELARQYPFQEAFSRQWFQQQSSDIHSVQRVPAECSVK
jgi:hypothetical protein